MSPALSVAHVLHGSLPHAAPAPANDEFASTVDQIADALREDPVLVHEVVGNGQTEALDAALSAKVEKFEVPVYVALVQPPTDVTSSGSEELTALLHAELGEGIYVVQSAGRVSFEIYGPIVEDYENAGVVASLAASASAQVVRDGLLDQCSNRECHLHPSADAGIILDVLAKNPTDTRDLLSDEQLQTYHDPLWVHRDIRPASEDYGAPFHSGVLLTALLAAMAVVLGTAMLYRLLQAVTARPVPHLDTPPTDEVRADATTTVAEVTRQLSGRTRIDDERRRTATEQRDRAARLLESSDQLDLVGALVLARTAEATLRGRSHKVCYYNPLHTGGINSHGLGGGLTVPACSTCRRLVADGHAPRALVEVRRLRPDHPYYRGNSVWATNGYGAFDATWWKGVGR